MSVRPYAGTMSRPILDQRQQYRGVTQELFDWMKAKSGVSNAFKVGYHVVDWWKIGADTTFWKDYISNDPLPAEAMRLKGALKDGKNAFGLIDLPERIYTFVKSFFTFMHGPEAGSDNNYLRLGYQTALDAAGVMSPLTDSAEFLSSRVMAIAPETLKQLGQINAGALLFSMLDAAANDIGRIWVATKILTPAVGEAEDAVRRFFGQERVEELNIDDRFDPEMVLELNLIDLAKCVSYIALAVIALVSAFVVAIPHASFWILVASTSALAFTIFGEFAQRSYRIINPSYPRLPDLVDRRPGAAAAAAPRGAFHGVDLSAGGVFPGSADEQPDGDDLGVDVDGS